MGSPGLQRGRNAGRLRRACGCLALLALSAAPAGAAAQEGWLADVDSLVSELSRPDERDLVFEELKAIFPEVRQIAFGDASGPSVEDGRAAFVWTALLLSTQPAEALRPLPPPDQLRREAARAARLLDATEAALLLHQLSERHFELGQLDEADALSAWALQELRPGAAHRMVFLRRRAEVARQQGRTSDARRWLRQAASLFESDERDPELQARTLAFVHGSLAQLFLDLGLLDVASAEVLRGCEMAERSGRADTIASLAFQTMEVELRQERYGAVERRVAALRQSEGFEKVDPRLRGLIQLSLGFARSEAERSNAEKPKRARATLAEALREYSFAAPTRMRAELELCDLAYRAADPEAQRTHLARARELLAKSSVLPGPERPLQEESLLVAYEARLALFEKAKPEELRERMAALERSFAAFLSHWENAPRNRAGGIGFLYHSQRREVLATLVDLARALDETETGTARAFGFLLRAQAMGSFTRSSGGGEVTLADVRRVYLRAGQGVLVYLPANGRSHVFALDGEHLRHARTAGFEQLSKTVDRIAGALARHPATVRSPERLARELGGASGELSRELLPASIAELVGSWRAVTIVGAELLGEIPFEALSLPGASMLGQSLAIDRIPSLPMGVLLARAADARPPPAADTPDVFLLATLEPSKLVPENPLGTPLARREFGDEDARRLLHAYAGRSTRRLLGSALTPTALDELRETLRSVPVIHFVAHGTYVRELERGAALALSPDDAHPDGLYLCADVEDGLKVGGLVILSACGTALGPRRLGDDNLAHLGGAFLRAGASCVIVSRAQIELESTMLLMERFHAALVAGAAPAEALRAARAAVADPKDPLGAYYAAQIQLVGLGQHDVLAR